jgi:hypothetical protein
MKPKRSLRRHYDRTYFSNRTSVGTGAFVRYARTLDDIQHL